MDRFTIVVWLFVFFLLGAVVVLAGWVWRARADRASALRRAEEEERRADDLAEKLHLEETARSSAESTAIQKEQLAAIGELSAMIAHEIRNPLTIIGNAVSTLRRKEIAPEDRATLYGILEEESRRLNGLMGDLLAYARPVSLELQRVDVREIMERALALVASHPGLDIELIESDPLGPVLADPKLLRQVFENLVTNAAQAMAREGGTLTVRITRGEESGLVGVNVTVEDTGEGMDTSVRSRALLPFFTTRPSGTGLGLAIVARFVHAHGGKLDIRSAAGRGTTATVFLPREELPKERQGTTS